MGLLDGDERDPGQSGLEGRGSRLHESGLGMAEQSAALFDNVDPWDSQIMGRDRSCIQRDEAAPDLSPDS